MKTKPILAVWGALLVLLAATMAATFMPLGGLLPFVSFGIAFAKAGLVAWFFMDMRQAPGFHRVALGVGFVWLAILLLLLASDFLTRSWAP